MAEALGLASSAAGIVSLGISVCHGLIDYYTSFKDQRTDIANTIASISALSSSLELLKSSVEDKKFDGKIVENVKKSIEGCEAGILSLEKKLDKMGQIEKVDLKSKIHDMGRRAMYPFRESTLVKLREIVDDVKSNLALALDTLHLHLVGVSVDKLDNLSKQVGDVGADVTQVGQNLADLRGLWEAFTNDQESQLCVEWISTMNFYSRQADMLNRRQHGTGQWLFDSEEFKQWLTGAEKTLWCSAGAGKTILAAAVIDTLTKTMTSPDIGLAYLYCNYKEQTTQTLVNLLGSIVQQLIKKRSGIPNDVFSMYKVHKAQGTRPSRAEYSKMLTSIASTFSQVYIVIDALDECEEGSGTRRDLISEFTSNAANWQLICTSRHLGDIEQIFEKSPRLEIRASDEDVRIYLEECIKSEGRLGDFCKKDPALQDLIIQNISENAKGMFLLAQLHIQSLARRLTVKAVRKALKNLPEKLDDTYSDAIERIKSQNEDKSELAMRLLSWISYASRPLEVREVQHAMASMDLDDDDDEADLDEDDIHAKDLLITICAGIVTIDKDSNVMRLVHYTTQEYFIRHRAEIFPTAVVEIPATCLRYLSLDPFQSGPCINNEDLIERLERYPLLRYAASEWGNHARGKPEEALKDQITDYLDNDNLRLCLSQLDAIPELRYGDWSQHFARNTSPLVIAAGFGLTTVVKFLLENGGDVNDTLDDSTTPLIKAASRGHEDVVRLLLDCGAKIDARGGGKSSNIYNRSSRGTTALHEAALGGHAATVQLLLAKGADIEALGSDGETAAKCAVAQGHKECVIVLLKHAAKALSPTALQELTGQCLLAASTFGNESILQAILDLSPGAGHLVPWAQSALQVAAANSYPAIVTLLLKCGAEVNHSHTQYYVYGSVLQAACMTGTLSLCKELLEMGANVNSRGGSDGSPLQAAAARNGDSSTEDTKPIVELLLDKGADVNARGGGFGSALHGASARDNEDVVQLLLARGADINMRSGPYGTALQAATRRKNVAVVRLLIKNNAEVTDQAKALLKYVFPDEDFLATKEEVPNDAEKESAKPIDASESTDPPHDILAFEVTENTTEDKKTNVNEASEHTTIQTDIEAGITPSTEVTKGDIPTINTIEAQKVEESKPFANDSPSDQTIKEKTSTEPPSSHHAKHEQDSPKEEPGVTPTINTTNSDDEEAAAVAGAPPPYTPQENPNHSDGLSEMQRNKAPGINISLEGENYVADVAI